MINYFDFFVIIATIGLAVYGLREGFLRGAVKLAGFIIVIVFISIFSEYIVKAALAVKILPPVIIIPLAFILIFLIGTIVFHTLAFFIHKLVHMTPAGFIDSGLGCAFGIIKAILLNGILATVLSLSPPDNFFYNQYKKSVSAQPLTNFLAKTIPVVKKSGVHLYNKFVPEHEKLEQKQNDGTIPPNII